MVALRWTLLPDKRGASIHRTDPDHDGYVLCGRLVDSHTPVHAHNPGFDVCVRCAVLVGEPVSGGFRSEVADHSNGNPDAEVRAVPRADTGSAARTGARRAAGTGVGNGPGRGRPVKARMGPAARPAAAPARPGGSGPSDMRASVAGGVPVHPRPPADWPPCKACEAGLPTRLAAGYQRKTFWSS